MKAVTQKEGSTWGASQEKRSFGKKQENGQDWLLISMHIITKLSPSMQPYFCQMAHCRNKMAEKKHVFLGEITPGKR